MGYDLHITRAEHWIDNQGEEITSAEWVQYVTNDPELSFAGVNGEFFTDWKGKSKYPEPWFDWYKGNIYTKNPDKPIVAKMLAIAKDLGARVQGDDGEFYDDISQYS